jgi:hypothetical protein
LALPWLHERQIAEFVQHYHRAPNHQGIGNALIAASGDMTGTGKVVSRDWLGGLVGFYYREAA